MCLTGASVFEEGTVMPEVYFSDDISAGRGAFKFVGSSGKVSGYQRGLRVRAIAIIRRC